MEGSGVNDAALDIALGYCAPSNDSSEGGSSASPGLRVTETAESETANKGVYRLGISQPWLPAETIRELLKKKYRCLI